LPLVAAILLVDLEVQRGGVVEDHLDVQIEQIGHPVEDGLLDGLLVRFQEVHGAVKLVQFQPCVPFDVRVFLEPLLVAVEFRGRGAGAVGDQGEQGALDIEAEVRAGLLPHDGVDAELLPDGFEHVEVAVGPGADQAPVTAGANDLFRRAAAQDALGQPTQTLDSRRDHRRAHSYAQCWLAIFPWRHPRRSPPVAGRSRRCHPPAVVCSRAGTWPLS
jgi:hypothetical protein